LLHGSRPGCSLDAKARERGATWPVDRRIELMKSLARSTRPFMSRDTDGAQSTRDAASGSESIGERTFVEPASRIIDAPPAPSIPPRWRLTAERQTRVRPREVTGRGPGRLRSAGRASEIHPCEGFFVLRDERTLRGTKGVDAAVLDRAGIIALPGCVVGQLHRGRVIEQPVDRR
jgi:hypothetical protein